MQIPGLRIGREREGEVVRKGQKENYPTGISYFNGGWPRKGGRRSPEILFIIPRRTNEELFYFCSVGSVVAFSYFSDKSQNIQLLF